MLSQQWRKSLGVGTVVLTGLLLLGILKAIFGIEASTNLFNTGITPGMIFGVASLLVALSIHKNWI